MRAWFTTTADNSRLLRRKLARLGEPRLHPVITATASLTGTCPRLAAPNAQRNSVLHPAPSNKQKLSSSSRTLPLALKAPTTLLVKGSTASFLWAHLFNAFAILNARWQKASESIRTASCGTTRLRTYDAPHSSLSRHSRTLNDPYDEHCSAITSLSSNIIPCIQQIPSLVFTFVA